MHYLTISFTHKNTNIEVREKLAFDSEKKLLNAYQKIGAIELVNELIILSTCNRVEIITSVKEPLKAIEPIFEIIAEITGVGLEELEGRGETYEDSGAIHHLFSVISSLDTMVIGETQIVGQLKDAFRFSYDKGFASQKIARAMHHAFRCAAKVRNSTDISKNPISVSSVAVAKAKEIYGGNLGGFTALIVGAGEMSRLACEHLAKNVEQIIPFGKNTQLKTIYSSIIISQEPHQREFKSPLQILNVSRIAKGKGHEDLIAACSILDENSIDFHLNIVGDGDVEYINSIKQLASLTDYKEKITFFGRSNDIPSHLNKNDIFLFPSEGEGLSNSFIEALSFGLICLAYDNTSFSEFTSLGLYCHLAKNEDLPDLKNILLLISNTLLLEKEKSTQNIQACKDVFSQKKEIKSYLELLY